MMNNAPELMISPKVAVRLSGTGGQGLLLAGRILAEAAAIFDGLNVAQTNSYGPEARGGASRSEVVISLGEVDDLRCRKFDVLVCLSQKACDAYFSSLAENGVLIVDSTNVTVVPTSRAIEVPMTWIAVEECHNVMVTNMIALGVLCGCTDLVTFDALISAVKSTLRPDLVQINEQALQLGWAAGQNIYQIMPEKRRPNLMGYRVVRPSDPKKTGADSHSRKSAPQKRTVGAKAASGGN